MRRWVVIVVISVLSLSGITLRGEESDTFDFPTVAPENYKGEAPQLRLRTNFLPWFLTVPNLGAEFVLNNRWSIVFDVWACPWKLTDKFSVKTVAIFPEARWWVKSTRKGSFFNIHGNVAWFNVRANAYRYQDFDRPLLGAGIGYGYYLSVNQRWGFEFEIGAGFANMKYDRYYNVVNGALKDKYLTTYWGIDRVGITLIYYLCNL